ncbi:putative secreted metallopeptidase [Leuconostoc inhae]|uniref:Secreted metallopeptidase n=2 Tax=Leuconostoc TaxID=1243 RepID=A0AAN2QTU2_9LACO|nr:MULTISPECIES: phage tail tip lysozyme [Leuconostoc]MBZ5957909.1 peptidoglycan DD-metalloendopeptidase family protein [Leuconostoc gasicomitatum]MBZ5982112.1 peptidoglycan DD-metalloendopeptidase family protein [Leuconostoc gasicomitatum]MBZ5987378.1 peptidoglycan DD-metalloendopeptidase family protein [Leuconostoc gasicomitatum]MBZ5989453.1 peptidoglycan DD-metalloendopeptidase family protein [Leuconostoc gasicomitatum]CUR63642.1 Peptidase family M23 protein [Leuconostoc gasicomitatum KG16-
MLERWIQDKKRRLYVIIGIITTAVLSISVIALMCVMVFSAQNADCWNDDTTIDDGGSAFGGDWKDPNSGTHHYIQHAIDRFHKEVKMSGDNIAAAIAIGLRESGFNPKAYNPSGQVKGIWQWGSGTTNGDRYGNTADTVKAQVQLAINELHSTHKATLINLATANNINSSMVAWDTKFEGVGVNDPQRKVADTAKTAKEVKKLFNLDYPGDINIFDGGSNDSGTGDTSDDANSSAISDATCDTGLVTNTDGLPVMGKYQITGGYPNYGGLTGAEHYGVDFQTVAHTMNGGESNVYAVHDGTVVAKSFDNTGGNWLVIQGTDNVYTYYGHAPTQSAIVVNTGDKVKAGQHISHEGQTGEATGIHVHFAVQTKSQYGWAPETKGLKSPGDYLKLPKPAGTNVVVPSGPFNSSTDKSK